MEKIERENAITLNGEPFTLIGEEIKIGEVAPNFKATKIDMSEISLEDYKGKIVVISAMPSVDTPVCELQTVKFNKEIEKRDDVILLTISMDLPFALKRFAIEHNIKNAVTVSDYKEREFANKYGLFIKELALVSRAVIIVDKDGKVVYAEYLKEIGEEVNYEKALEVLKSIE